MDLVAGAGGFIGGHMVKRLLSEGRTVVAVDIKPLDEWQIKPPEGVRHFHGYDLRTLEDCREAVVGVERVYNFAADMGGMGFIETHKAECMLSVLINTHLLMASREVGVDRFWFSSSACAYNQDKQSTTDNVSLKEADAHPANPEDGYGWEKLFSERMCRHFAEDYGLTTRTARYHNVYGTHTSWTGGREKAPAAISRKVAEAYLSGDHSIEIWGDGEQTRSFMYVDDCIEGTRRIMDSDIDYPINLGSSELVSINQLVTMVEDIAGIKLKRTYDLDAPKGVRGRNSDNTLILRELGWEPSIPLQQGLEKTYEWVFNQVKGSL